MIEHTTVVRGSHGHSYPLTASFIRALAGAAVKVKSILVERQRITVVCLVVDAIEAQEASDKLDELWGNVWRDDLDRAREEHAHAHAGTHALSERQKKERERP